MDRTSAAAMTAFRLGANADRAQRVNDAIERRRQEALAKLSPEARAQADAKDAADKAAHEERMAALKKSMEKGRRRR